MEHVPQFQIDQIVLAIKTAMSDCSPRITESVSSTIRQELSSPASMQKFDNLLERYHKANSDFTTKFEEFNKNILQNQLMLQSLLQQIIDDGSGDCPMNPDLKTIKDWLDELLNGDEYRLKQQIRDILESGWARRMRNVVVISIAVAAVLAVLGGVAAYMEVTSAVKSAMSDIIIQAKGVDHAQSRP